MPKKTSDNYINFRKKITCPKQIRGIHELAEYWMVSELDVCFRVFSDAVANEVKKKREIEDIKKKTAI